MAQKSYEVKTMGGRTALIVVHETRSEMLGAASLYRGGVDFGPTTNGVYQGPLTMPVTDCLGPIRVNEEDLTLEVVLHEAVHCALHEIRLVIGLEGLLKDGDDRDLVGEEMVAHAVADLQVSVLTVLNQAGYKLI